jgi:hypothetical protein
MIESTDFKKKIIIRKIVKIKIKFSSGKLFKIFNSNKKIDLLFCKFKSCPTYGITNPKLKISAKLDKIIKKTKKIR